MKKHAAFFWETPPRKPRETPVLHLNHNMCAPLGNMREAG